MAAIVFLMNFDQQGSVHRPIRFLLATYIFGVIAAFIIVASQYEFYSWSKAAVISTIFIYLFILSGFGLLLGIDGKNFHTPQSGPEIRFISPLYYLIRIITMATLIAAMCSYPVILKHGATKIYFIEKKIFWIAIVSQWCVTILKMVMKYSYRGMMAKEKIKETTSNRVRIYGLFIAMVIVCEIHGAILLSYPPTNWTNMAGVVAVGFLIGIVYYKSAVTKHTLHCETIDEYLTSKKLSLANGDEV
ncbi:hypothetical protein BC943DRAFT_328432 [Umbelopsis sp. AD052]|nr:hypothetical protein BC943DRAFT_328432 [Umbelopsis sp. AD052]